MLQHRWHEGGEEQGRRAEVLVRCAAAVHDADGPRDGLGDHVEQHGGGEPEAGAVQIANYSTETENE